MKGICRTRKDPHGLLHLPSELPTLPICPFSLLPNTMKTDLDSGTDILYIYDGWRCIEERNAASPSTVMRQYVYGGQYIDEVVCKIEDPGGTPAKLFYLHDCNYNVVALTNTSGVVQERYNYESYGGLTIAEDDYDVIPATTQNNSLTFQGQRYDAESGLYYFRNRYYSPVLGRLVQRDARTSYPLNPYNLEEGSPLSMVDPSGDESQQHDFYFDNPEGIIPAKYIFRVVISFERYCRDDYPYIRVTGHESGVIGEIDITGDRIDYRGFRRTNSVDKGWIVTHGYHITVDTSNVEMIFEPCPTGNVGGRAIARVTANVDLVRRIGLTAPVPSGFSYSHGSAIGEKTLESQSYVFTIEKECSCPALSYYTGKVAKAIKSLLPPLRLPREKLVDYAEPHVPPHWRVYDMP